MEELTLKLTRSITKRNTSLLDEFQMALKDQLKEEFER